MMGDLVKKNRMTEDDYQAMQDDELHDKEMSKECQAASVLMANTLGLAVRRTQADLPEPETMDPFHLLASLNAASQDVLPSTIASASSVPLSTCMPHATSSQSSKQPSMIASPPPRLQPFVRSTPSNGRLWDGVDQERLVAREAVIRAKMRERAARKAEGVEGGVFGMAEKVDGGADLRAAATSHDTTETAQEGFVCSTIRTPAHDGTSPRPLSAGRSPLKPLILASSASFSPSLSSSRPHRRRPQTQRQTSQTSTGSAKTKVPVAALSTRMVMPEQAMVETQKVKDIPRRKAMKRQPSALELKYRSLPSPSSVCGVSPSVVASSSPDQKPSNLQHLLILQAITNRILSSPSPFTRTTPHCHTPSSKHSEALSNSTPYASLYGSMSPRTPVSPSPGLGLLTPTYTVTPRARAKTDVNLGLMSDMDDENLAEEEFRRLSMYLVDPYQRSPSPRRVEKENEIPLYKRKWLRGIGLPEENRARSPAESEEGSKLELGESDTLRVSSSVISPLPGARGAPKRKMTPIFRNPNVSAAACASPVALDSATLVTNRRNGMEFSRDVDVPAPVWAYRASIGDIVQGLVRSVSRGKETAVNDALQRNEKNLSSPRSRRPSSDLRIDVPLSPPPSVPLPPLPVGSARSIRRPSKSKKGNDKKREAYPMKEGETRTCEKGVEADRHVCPPLAVDMSWKSIIADFAFVTTMISQSFVKAPGNVPVEGEANRAGVVEASSVSSYVWKEDAATPVTTKPAEHGRSMSMTSVLSLQDEAVSPSTLTRFPSPPTRFAETTAAPIAAVDGISSCAEEPSCGLADSGTIADLLAALNGSDTPRTQSLTHSACMFYDNDLTSVDLEESFDSFDSNIPFGSQRTRQSVTSLGVSSCGSAGGPSTPLISLRGFQDSDVVPSPEIRISTWEVGSIGHYDSPIHRSEQYNTKGDLGGRESVGQPHAPESWVFNEARLTGTSNGREAWQELSVEKSPTGSPCSTTQINPRQQMMSDATSEKSASIVRNHDNGEISEQARPFSSTYHLPLPEPLSTDLADWGEPENLDNSC
ncbi:hypothetical protein QFC21_002493 [Naganishia friedmannii]|uniref:Uncharacterized protein n=1 Tax=Naganishia friedmannii TaxID=89922 RepID=A0ACC2VVB2_9TREE|nr:hypothetical protein QFC21_002493 [Naganishia friedmannii]